jgi:hypothetical protein
MAVTVGVAIAAVAAWLAWPLAVGMAWRRGRLSPTAVTALLFARAPVVVGIGAVVGGVSPAVVAIAVAAMLLGSALLFRYFRELFTAPPLSEGRHRR